MSTAQDLPLGSALPYGEPIVSAPTLRLVPTQPLDFDDAVSRVRPRLHRYATRRLGDAHEAEELVQEALLRAYTHREQLLTEEDLSAWTTVVTGRLVIDRLRVRGRSTTVADVPEGTRIGRDTADVVVARDEARTALDALDAMPARQAALLWAREVEGRSYEDLCARFEMTEPAVRSVLTRARKALRKEYALRGGTLPVGGLAVLAPWVSGLTFADKLRGVVGRITSPAALGAVGITALGGLILSPFGIQQGGSGTFTPTQAVVNSQVVAATSALQAAPLRSTQTRAASVRPGDTTTGTNTLLLGVAPRPLDALEATPCTEKSDPSLVPAGLRGIPDGVGLGGSHCIDGKAYVSAGPALPASASTGVNSLGLATDLIDCEDATVSAVTTQTPGTISCTQETQK